jgi:hypothetical protein
MRHSSIVQNTALGLAGLVLISCGGRVAGETGTPAGGNAGHSGSDGDGSGGSGGAGSSGTVGTGPSGSSGTTVGSGGSTVGGWTGGVGGWTGGVGGSAGGVGGWTGGVGGSAGIGGWTGGVGGAGASGGSGGSTGGASGSAGSSPCSTGGSGGVMDPPSGYGAGGTSSVAPSEVSIDAAFFEAGTPLSDAGWCYCTRRPGPGVSLQCPAGIDESTWVTLGPAGGAVVLKGRQAIASGVATELTILPKTLDKAVMITLTETSIPPPRAFLDWSPIYEIIPACMQTSSIMKLRLPWGNRPGVSPPGVTVYHARDRNSPFTAMADVYPNAGFIDAAITEFGLYFVGVPRPPDHANCP